jgi:ferredoxin
MSDDRCPSCGLPLSQCNENRQIVMDFLERDTDEGGEIEWVDNEACFMCGLPLTEENGAVELVYDDGETEWICFPCAARLPRERLEHPDYPENVPARVAELLHDAERVEARDRQWLSEADRDRPIEDVPPNERL